MLRGSWFPKNHKDSLERFFMKEIFSFKINIIECEEENFRKSILADNLCRGRILAIVMIGLETILAVIDVSASILEVDNRFHFSYYLIMYLLMICINIIPLILIRRFKDFQEKPVRQLRNLEIGLVAYITLVMSWGSIVSLMDQKLYGQLMVFMVNMIICSVMYFLDNRKILVPYVCSVLILIFGLPFFQNSKDVLIGHYVNLCIFIFISWLASRIIFLSYCNNYRSKALLEKSNILLEREIEQNTIINRKLTTANLQLKKLALVDELTEIPNRRSFRNHIDMAFETYFKEKSLLSIIMVDIDYFKQFNDYYGHNEGDRVLKVVANQINSIVRHNMDFVARWGGEEFIYASFNTKEEEIGEIAETIRSKVFELKISHESSKTLDYISVSIGTCSIEVSGKADVSKGIELADKALYLAKTSGRNCVKRWSLQ